MFNTNASTLNGPGGNFLYNAEDIVVSYTMKDKFIIGLKFSVSVEIKKMRMRTGGYRRRSENLVYVVNVDYRRSAEGI